MATGKNASSFSLVRVLTRDGGASTVVRLFESHLVADLQLIFLVSCLLMVVGSIFVFVWHGWVDTTGVIGSAALISAIIGIGSGVLAWTYQTGSARLGVADLFTCEITTICRVVAIAETASNFVEMYKKPPPLFAPKFSSEEQYSPIFNQNCRDLEMLEARTVEPVTEFYTYLKTFRDYQRMLSNIERPQEEADRWRNGLRNVIYMLFLMLESARKSVDRLVEYEPERATQTITILLSELVAFDLLLNVFKEQAPERRANNARLENLQLRERDYPNLVPALFEQASSNRDSKEWHRAVALIGELNFRYHEVFGTWLDPDAAFCAGQG